MLEVFRELARRCECEILEGHLMGDHAHMLISIPPILKKYEDFRKVERGPDFAGTPFDLFGYKRSEPYIIELKCSLNNLQYPGEIQKKRMKELLKNIHGLHVALLQLNLKKSEYRMFYDDQMDLLFYGSKMPLAPIEDWIRGRL